MMGDRMGDENRMGVRMGIGWGQDGGRMGLG